MEMPLIKLGGSKFTKKADRNRVKQFTFAQYGGQCWGLAFRHCATKSPAAQASYFIESIIYHWSR